MLSELRRRLELWSEPCLYCGEGVVEVEVVVEVGGEEEMTEGYCSGANNVYDSVNK